jgi:putative ABC transport system permease protein
VKALDRKLWRDLRHLRGQALAVAAIVAAGVASFVTARSAYDSLWAAHLAYYRDYRFAHVFASLKRAPLSVSRRLAEIPGVESVEPRVVVGVTLDVPGLPDLASARVVSVPERRPVALNRLHIRRGRALDPARPEEALVSVPFAEANRLQPGSRLGALLNGRWERLVVVGLALSPEFVTEIPTAGLLPDKRRFGTLWMNEKALARAFDMDGAFNDVCLSLGPGASEKAVVGPVDRALDRYGGLGAYGREDHPSHARFTQEFDELRAWGRLMPALFLGIAAFLLQIVSSRLVLIQRDQIAVLKAFGYTNARIAGHYLALVLVIVAGGLLVGFGAGLYVGRGLLAQYEEYFRFPQMPHRLSPELVAWGLAVSALAAVAGALGAVRRAVNLPPAEAMRPEAPPRFRAGFLERTPLLRRASPPGRILVRNLARRPWRVALSVLSIALAGAVLVVGRYFLDAMDVLMDVHFRTVERQQATVFFTEPKSDRARYELQRAPGVLRVEPFRTVPIRLRFGSRVERTLLIGLAAGPELRRIVGLARRVVLPPPTGVVLTDYLAESLGARVGDVVSVEVLEGERRTRDTPVVGLTDEPLGTAAYMELGALSALLRTGGLSGAYLAVDPARQDAFNAALKAIPSVGGVAWREATIRSYQETIADVFGMFTSILIGLASVIAVGVVYNGARITLSERARELASLRVLGFTRGEVGTMLLGEQAVLILLGLPLGGVLGYALSGLIAGAYQNELIRLPLVMTSASFAFSFLVIVVAAAASGLLVKARADRLDLVAVLKTRE